MPRRPLAVAVALAVLAAACSAGDAAPTGTTVAPARPLTLVVLGDSLTAPVGTGGAADWLRWADPDGTFELIGNAGVPGERSDQILARVAADVIARRPGWVTVLAGTNDISVDVRAEPIIFNLTRIYDALEAAGINFVAITIPPLVMLTPERVATHQAVNAWLRARVEADWPNATLGDWSAALSVGGDDISPNAGMFPDGVHFSEAGAEAAGNALAPLFAELAAG